MKRKLLSLLVLLTVAATGARADYGWYDGAITIGGKTTDCTAWSTDSNNPTDLGYVTDMTVTSIAFNIWSDGNDRGGANMGFRIWDGGETPVGEISQDNFHLGTATRIAGEHDFAISWTGTENLASLVGLTLEKGKTYYVDMWVKTYGNSGDQWYSGDNGSNYHAKLTIATYTASFADDNDNDGWAISPTSGMAGTEVTVIYSGLHKVKSVTVEKKTSPLLEGKFTINASGDQVQFSRGNLQAVIGSGPTDTYNYTASSWKFAKNQWDYIGIAAGNTTFAAGSTVDLFGWVGTSASYDTYGLCTNTSANNEYYGTSASDNLKSDWGNTIGTGWRTLTSAEWEWILGPSSSATPGTNCRASGSTVNSRSNARYTQATINTDSTGVNGLILFPDGVTIEESEATSWGTINGQSTWVTKCTTAQWTALAAKGCVFLPAAGFRDGTTVTSVMDQGRYWSSTPSDGADHAKYVLISSSFGVNPQYQNSRNNGYSVRLVKDVE